VLCEEEEGEEEEEGKTEIPFTVYRFEIFLNEH